MIDCHHLAGKKHIPGDDHNAGIGRNNGSAHFGPVVGAQVLGSLVVVKKASGAVDGSYFGFDRQSKGFIEKRTLQPFGKNFVFKGPFSLYPSKIAFAQVYSLFVHHQSLRGKFFVNDRDIGHQGTLIRLPPVTLVSLRGAKIALR